MLNEDRIILMTKMAYYEENGGRKTISIGNYYRSDFISLNLIKSWIFITIAFILVVGMWGIYKADYFIDNIDGIDYISLRQTLLFEYAIVMAAYLLVSYIYYSIVYSDAKKSIKRYQMQLKKMSKLYENEEKKQNQRDNLGGNGNHDSFTGV